MKRIGLFGGSFNPVHNGHIALAVWMLEHSYVDELWLLLSPKNPLKGEHDGATDEQRQEMLKLACENVQGLHPCFIEFEMPRPSYTINTLKQLSSKYPNHRFSLIIGADNWLIFDKWRNSEEILRNYGVMIYPRPHYPIVLPDVGNVTYLADAPTVDISSTTIRKNVSASMSMLPAKVAEYIRKSSLYEYNHE